MTFTGLSTKQYMLILFLFAVLHVTRPIIFEPEYWDRSLRTKKEENGRKYDNGFDC
jgi:hypothetical protein